MGWKRPFDSLPATRSANEDKALFFQSAFLSFWHKFLNLIHWGDV